jgi:hypothetical protein
MQPVSRYGSSLQVHLNQHGRVQETLSVIGSGWAGGIELKHEIADCVISEFLIDKPARDFTRSPLFAARSTTERKIVSLLPEGPPRDPNCLIGC